MSPEAIKDRFNRAVEQGVKVLTDPHSPVKWDNVETLRKSNFHIQASWKNRILKIRIALDRIAENDIRAVQETSCPDNVTKAIWLKRKGCQRFEPREF
jgi:hypothetical protein